MGHYFKWPHNEGLSVHVCFVSESTAHIMEKFCKRNVKKFDFDFLPFDTYSDIRCVHITTKANENARKQGIPCKIYVTL
jgi:hypothetical protein